jgi:2-keto-4-pentenoate hydratase/2-oxohepta-3-ene-1,7-dioic acid hydratase in catechol pathway
VPADKLDRVLRVQTRVNGVLRQDATTNDLIFSIPFLLKTMSEGQTLMPGDVLATGTVSNPRWHLRSDQLLIAIEACWSWNW